MADLSKFEKMLELLINEDREAAEELFHEIVVEKSRDIYESLLEDEDEEVDESDDEEVDESDEDLDEADDEEVDESDEDLDENFDLDEFEVEGDPMDMGGDPTDDMMADLGMDDEGGDDMDMDDEGGDTNDRIEDLEDALEDLKAEFEKMMAGDDGDDMDMDGDDEEGDDMDMDDEGDDMDMDDEGDDEEEKESFAFEAKHDKKDKDMAKKTKKTAGEEMREYVEKVNGGDLGSKIGGDNGVNTKSIIAKPNNMGGTTANIAKSGTEAGVEANKGNLKGSALSDQNPKDMNTKNVNVPGAKGATKMSNQPGHGAEKKGKPDTADKGATSTLNKLSSRAK